MNQQQFNFLKEYIRSSDKITSYTLAYGPSNNYTAVESAANRLLRNPEIAEYIQQIRDSARREIEEELKEQLREELLTVYDKRLICKKVVTREMQIEVKYKGKNCTQCSHYMGPDYRVMLYYMKEDSMLAGHYPQKAITKNHNKTQQPGYCPPAAQCPPQARGVTTQELGVDTREGYPQKSQKQENHNIPIAIETQQSEQTPLFLEGELGNDVKGSSLPIGVIDSQTVNLFQDDSGAGDTENHNKTQQPAYPGTSPYGTGGARSCREEQSPVHKSRKTISHSGLRRLVRAK